MLSLKFWQRFSISSTSNNNLKVIIIKKKNQEGGDIIGKLILLSFDDSEEDVINSILSILESGRKIYRLEENLLPSEIHYGDLMIVPDKREVTCHGRRAALTFTEFEILQLLAQNPGQVFGKEQIYDIVWKEPYDGDYNIVMSHIRHIREKIEDDPSHPIYIQTVWGVGYRFNKNLSNGL